MSAVDSFGFKMIKYGDNLTDVNRKATIAAAMVYKSGVLTSAAGFTGGDRRFSKWKGKLGPSLGAGFEVGQFFIKQVAVTSSKLNRVQFKFAAQAIPQDPKELLVIFPMS